MLSAMFFASCSKSERGKIEYVPFQETSDGQWGMISLDGKVLFTDEFKKQPTVVRDGRFFVKTKEGVWEMYEASEKPKKIGGDYAHTSGFNNGVAVVAEKDKPVSIIDTDGKTVKELKTIEGKTIDGVRSFCGGYAAFMTTDSLWGAINESGDCVVKPEYCVLYNCSDGKFVGIKAKYKDKILRDRKDKTKITVLDTGGKDLFEFSADKYEDLHPQFVDGLMAVSVKKDGKVTWGLINDKGETVVKPTAKIKNIGTIKGETFTYYNGEGWGLMNTKGETLIRAKYEGLLHDIDDVFLAVVKDGDDYQYKYIDGEDKELSDEKFVNASLFSFFDGEHAIVKSNDKIYSIIDRDCKQLEGLPDIADISIFEGEEYIESDYVDMGKMLAAYNITADGVMGISTNSTAKSVVDVAAKQGVLLGTDEHPAQDPYWYDYKSVIDLHKDVEGVRGDVSINFRDNLSRQTYRTKRVVDYSFGDWYWYHDDKIPTGYVWNDVKPANFTLSIDNSGRMHGKLRTLYSVLSSKFKAMGTVAKENNSAMVVELKGGHRALIAMTKNRVFATWGELVSADQIDISEYKDAVEDGEGDDVSGGSLNDLMSSVAEDSVAVVDSATADSAAADSTAADSTAAYW